MRLPFVQPFARGLTRIDSDLFVDISFPRSLIGGHQVLWHCWNVNLGLFGLEMPPFVLATSLATFGSKARRSIDVLPKSAREELFAL